MANTTLIYNSIGRAMMRRVLMTGLGLLLVACSDGVAPSLTEIAVPSVSPPVINQFTGTGVADPSATGASIAVAAGDSVELAWSVTGAKQVLLKSDSSLMAEHEVPAEGTELVANISAEQTFILSAYTEGAAAVQQTVQVRIKPKASATILQFGVGDTYEDPASVEANRSFTLCYEVQPADALVQVFAPDGRELAPAVIESTEGGDESSPTTTEGVEDAWGPLPEGLAISIMAPSLNLPPVGHSAETVAPETTGGTTDTEGSAAATVRGCVVEESATPGMATYRLVATLSDGTSAEETADVTAAEGIALVDFSASVDGAQATSVAAGQAFELVWHVTPATASGYQLVLDPGGVDVTSLTATGEGQYAVKEGISASASYTLTLKSADGVQLDQKQLAVTVSEPEELAPVSATLTVTPESVFAGEPVTITVTVNGTEDGATDATGVSIVGPDGAALAEGALSATHNPTEPGNNQYQVKINGEVKDIKTVYVRGFDSLYTGVGAAVTNADKGAFFGLEQDLAGNDLSIARQTEENVAQPLKLNFIDSFLKVYTVSTNSAEFAKFNPYRVNAIAIHPSNPDLVAIGASGALYLSTKDKEGKTVYPLVEAMPYRVDGDGTHASCKGTTQKGRNAKGTGKNPFAGLLQVCDLLFLPNGGLVMAWDGGIAYHTDVAAYHKGHKEGFNGWKGLLKKENMLTGHIVNDLFYDSQGQTVYVAADSGIFKVGVEAINADAPAFGVVGNLDKPYTVAVGADGTLYAGTADGLYRSTAGGSFEAVSGVTGPVYAIAEEASVATLYVGTAKGLVVLRNGQVSTTIADKIGEEVRAIAIDPSLHDTHIYVASKKGIYFSHGSKHGGVGEKHGADTDELPLPPTPPASAPEPPVESPEVPAGAAGANSHLIK